MKTIIAIFVTLALAGCGALGGNSMSPEQMAQAVKDKNAVVGCTSGTGPWGKVGAVYVDTNKINDNNSVTVTADCTVTVTGTKAVPAAK